MLIISRSIFPIDVRRFYWVQIAVLILALGHHSSSNAGVMCPDHTQSALEEIYCRLVTTSFGKSLPNETEFRNNSEQIQRILLKTPAAKAGIQLPAKAIKHPSSINSESPKPFLIKKQQEETFDPKKHCRTTANEINCNDWGTFHLQLNRPLKALSENALSPENKMQLQDYTGDPENHEQLSRHLSIQYETYLNKMNSIGLAESILSWQKFTTIFFATIKKYPPVNQKQSFSKRFDIMFEALKSDKQSLVSPSSSPDRSFDLAFCSAVGLELMVCQIQNRSYLFKTPNEH